MKGLLIKDLYLIKKLCRMVIVMDLLFVVFSIFDERNLFFSYYCCLITGITPISLISYDEQGKWDVFAGTLPYSRAQLVSVKYLVGLLCSAFVLILLAAAQAAKRVYIGSFVPGDYFSFLAVLASLCLLLPSLVFPLVFKFGAEKGRIFNMVVVGVACAVSALATTYSMNQPIKLRFILPGAPSLVIAALFYFLSWRLSIRIYTKREL